MTDITQKDVESYYKYYKNATVGYENSNVEFRKLLKKIDKIIMANFRLEKDVLKDIIDILESDIKRVNTKKALRQKEVRYILRVDEREKEIKKELQNLKELQIKQKKDHDERRRR